MKLNRKGYMLVEIILASAIAFGVGYFILQMVINLKNKNDDLLVETLSATDQTIIMNKLMQYANSSSDFDCSKLKINDKKIIYDTDIIDIVNEYVDVGTISCNNDQKLLSITIPLSVKQIKDKSFDVNFRYVYSS